MRFLLLLILTSASVSSAAEMKALVGSMHGQKMAVEYIRLNTGMYILLVRETSPEKQERPVFTDRQTIDLKMKASEAMSVEHSFRCVDKAGAFAYAVFEKSKAHPKDSFHPNRAWLVNEKTIHLDPVTDPNTINCTWYREGEAEYPFKQKAAK